MKIKHKRKTRKLKSLNIQAKLHAYVTYHNLILTLCKVSGKIIGWESCGTLGFKNAKKRSPYAIQNTVLNISQLLKSLNIYNIYLIFNGPIITNREIIYETLISKQIKIFKISEKINIPYNGCRLPKIRYI
uniref:Ribosomal protein S11 n=1 Tax=Spumella sp. NIES-1846 TaxID=2490549 RepID=A0A455REL2_9STRA|nr:ribosomal protein S11 [Spumella sp. NIES-1846]